ncbi:ribosome small subunit-dependent GTPase A [Nesterenkonia alkaliphila]|nr:ribosome small subunit-dependent GTPase A [Nesterenkonia alkaliphila]GFZ84148.1 putative ribosome biogenesis GTPase RsgA [Nesterenkonia alkaliphila]
MASGVDMSPAGGTNWRDWDESRVRVRANKKGSRPRTKETPDYSDAQLARVVQVDRGRYTCALLQPVRHEQREVPALGAKAGAAAAGREAAGQEPRPAGPVQTPERLCGPGRGVPAAGTVAAMRAKALRRTPVVPGDLVRLVGDTSGAEGSLARLVQVEERRTLLRRSADDSDEAERVVVANADQLLIVVAAANPEPRTGFIDRALVAAYEAGIDPILLITKADLADSPQDPAGLVSHYSELELTTVISGREEQDRLAAAAVAQLRELLAGKVTALIGHSGVGKSTMVNALTGADRATGGVNAVTGRGRHTSSSAVALQLEPAPELSGELPPEQASPSAAGPEPTGSSPAAGWVIDTPGVRSFGLAHVSPDDVLAAFEDLVQGSVDCEPGCAHESPAGGCALDAYVAAGHAGSHGPARLASLRNLLASLAGSQDDGPQKHLGSVTA